MELISVIMPIYNSRQFLSIAIESVLNQTYKNFELLLIDDGSNDGSGEICDYYQKKDKRVKVIHKKNEGVCKARNIGISLSKGKYIAFIDNDDEYDINFLKYLYEEIINKNSEVVKCGRRNLKITTELKILSRTDFCFKNVTYDIENFIDNYNTIRSTGILSSIWNGLYKSSTIKQNGINFEEDLRHGNEDIIFNTMFFEKCNKISFINKILYTHYYRISHSTSMHYYPDQIDSRIKSIKLEKNLILKTKNKIQIKYLELFGIIECFKILAKSNDDSQRNIGIKKIQDGIIINSMLQELKIGRDKLLTNRQKLELFLIKKEMFKIYFGIYSLKNIL